MAQMPKPPLAHVDQPEKHRPDLPMEEKARVHAIYRFIGCIGGLGRAGEAENLCSWAV